jgi:hypothetical protein
MRDFHDQKELFKDIQTFVENRKKAEPNYTYLDGLTWVSAQIYVVDFFLWFMAQHGYTLQKSRVPNVEFHDIEEELKANFKRRLEQYAKAEAADRAGDNHHETPVLRNPYSGEATPPDPYDVD